MTRPRWTAGGVFSLARNRRIFKLWLACHTQQEFAEAVGCDKAEVSRLCCEMADLPKLNKPDRAVAEHATDFEPPIYNIWKQQRVTGSRIPPLEKGVAISDTPGGPQQLVTGIASTTLPTFVAVFSEPNPTRLAAIDFDSRAWRSWPCILELVG